MTGQQIPERVYVYRAHQIRVIDGDTIDVNIDMGLHAYRIERLRLLGINCPEMHGPSHQDGMTAKKYTEDWLLRSVTHATSDWPLLIRTEKSDVFGRYLAVVWDVSTGACLNDDLLTSGNAVVFER